MKKSAKFQDTPTPNVVSSRLVRDLRLLNSDLIELKQLLSDPKNYGRAKSRIKNVSANAEHIRKNYGIKHGWLVANLLEVERNMKGIHAKARRVPYPKRDRGTFSVFANSSGVHKLFKTALKLQKRRIQRKLPTGRKKSIKLGPGVARQLRKRAAIFRKLRPPQQKLLSKASQSGKAIFKGTSKSRTVQLLTRMGLVKVRPTTSRMGDGYVDVLATPKGKELWNAHQKLAKAEGAFASAKAVKASSRSSLDRLMQSYKDFAKELWSTNKIFDPSGRGEHSRMVLGRYALLIAEVKESGYPKIAKMIHAARAEIERYGKKRDPTIRDQKNAMKKAWLLMNRAQKAFKQTPEVKAVKFGRTYPLTPAGAIEALRRSAAPIWYKIGGKVYYLAQRSRGVDIYEVGSVRNVAKGDPKVHAASWQVLDVLKRSKILKIGANPSGKSAKAVKLTLSPRALRMLAAFAKAPGYKLGAGEIPGLYKKGKPVKVGFRAFNELHGAGMIQVSKDTMGPRGNIAKLTGTGRQAARTLL